MLEQLKQECLEANLLLPKYQLIDLTFGNVSVIDRQAGILAIKPSGVPYETMTAEHIVLVDLDGARVEGNLNPSSDTPTHLRLYHAFAGIGGVVHTHSRYATSFAQAGRPIPCFGTTHADYFHGEIPVTRKLRTSEINGDYERETGNVIAERFASLDPTHFPGVLVQSHGPFAWGPNGKKAVEHAFAIEILAQMAFQTQLINPAIEPVSQPLLDKHFLRKHGRHAYYGQSKQ